MNIEKYSITAAEAREISTNSVMLESRIFKLIKEQAKESYTTLTYVWGDEDVNEYIKENIVSTLTTNGFKVEKLHEEDEDGGCVENGLKISW